MSLDAYRGRERLAPVPESRKRGSKDFVAQTRKLATDTVPAPATMHRPMNEHKCRHRPILFGGAIAGSLPPQPRVFAYSLNAQLIRDSV